MKTMTELQQELEEIISWFESEQAEIDQAESKYKRGLELAKELEDRLKETKNNIAKLKQTFEA